MHANERDIQKRMQELESSLGGILPQPEPWCKIEHIVHKAEEEELEGPGLAAVEQAGAPSQ